jgi:FtsP/CotA-like multicopper oxidase with cupredoxin domain
MQLRTLHYDRGHNIADPGPIALLDIEVAAPTTMPAPLPSSWGTFAPLAVDQTTPRRPMVLREDDTVPNQPTFSINNEAFPNVTPVAGALDQVEVWEIENLAEMDHPFHLHGMFFQIVDEAGAPIGPRGWKDTVNVPQLKTVRVAVRFDAPGRWMYHCHILEHAERGMMGELAVVP